MPVGLLGAAAITGGASLIGGLLRPRRDRRSERLLSDRLAQISDPDFMRSEFLGLARDLAPSQSDILSRLRAGGVGLGNASILANQQFKADQSRARTAGAQAFSQFQLNNQNSINSLIAQIVGQNNQQQGRQDSFNNQILGGLFGLGGTLLGRSNFGFGGSGSQQRV